MTFLAPPDVDLDATAVVDLAGTRATTWRTLDRHLHQVAAGLQAEGLGSDDAVAVISGNRSEFIEVLLGAIRGGVTGVPVNWHLSADEAAYIVANSRSRVVVCDRDFEPLAREAAKIAGVERVLVLGESFDAWRDAQRDDPPQPPVSGAAMLYSSGTTGRPKGITRPPAPSPEATLAGLAAIGRFYGYPDGGVHLVTGPLYHGAPLAFAAYALALGQSTVLMERFDAERALQLIAQHRITTVHLVPIMFVRLLRLPAEARARYDLSSLEAIHHGAAPCPAWAKREMIDWLGPIVTEYYGSTEGGGPTKITSAEWLERPGSVGRPIDGLTIHVLDDGGHPLGPGEVGTLWFTSNQGPPAYLGDEEKTNANRLDGGRFTVGDVGYIDDAGYLYLSDRKIDMIISGGVNIYPAEVEACLGQHPAVADCTVFGIPDDEWGEQVKAAVQLGEGHSATADELIGWCRDRIAGFKAPKSIDFHERLPRDDAGKLRKRFLRDEYWADRETKI